MAIGQAKQAFEKEIMPADALTTAAESLRSTVLCVCSMHGPVSRCEFKRKCLSYPKVWERILSHPTCVCYLHRD